MMNEKMDILNWLYENGYVALGMQTIETMADLFSIEELRNLMKEFAEL